MSKVRAIRGATTAEENSDDSIIDATLELLKELIDANNLNDADVISLSLGGGQYQEVLESAVNYSVANGSVTIAASGNINNNMDFYEWSFQDSLRVSQQGIPEPNTKKKVIPDVLIVPLVGFDRYKFRLGYGGGFYDRYISKILKFKKILTVGFAFSFQEISKIPINKFDQKLNFILTDKEIIK